MTNSLAAPSGRPGLCNGSNSLDSLPVGRVLPRVPGIDFGWQSNHLVYRKALCSGNLARVVSRMPVATFLVVFLLYWGRYAGLSR
jgi:hypothetical protein